MVEGKKEPLAVVEPIVRDLDGDRHLHPDGIPTSQLNFGAAHASLRTKYFPNLSTRAAKALW
jgi:hypothetical protein